MREGRGAERGPESPAGKEGHLGLLEKCRGGQTLRLAPLWVAEGVRGGGVVCYGTLPSPMPSQDRVGHQGPGESAMSPAVFQAVPTGHPALP